MLGGSISELRKVPLEESRSWIVHLPDPNSMTRCFDEIQSSLMATLLPRTTRPIRILDPGLNSRVSPERGPLTMISFKYCGSMNSFQCVIERWRGIGIKNENFEL